MVSFSQHLPNRSARQGDGSAACFLLGRGLRVELVLFNGQPGRIKPQPTNKNQKEHRSTRMAQKREQANHKDQQTSKAKTPGSHSKTKKTGPKPRSVHLAAFSPPPPQPPGKGSQPGAGGRAAGVGWGWGVGITAIVFFFFSSMRAQTKGHVLTRRSLLDESLFTKNTYATLLPLNLEP